MVRYHKVDGDKIVAGSVVGMAGITATVVTGGDGGYRSAKARITYLVKCTQIETFLVGIHGHGSFIADICWLLILLLLAVVRILTEPVSVPPPTITKGVSNRHIKICHYVCGVAPLVFLLVASLTIVGPNFARLDSALVSAAAIAGKLITGQERFRTKG